MTPAPGRPARQLGGPARVLGGPVRGGVNGASLVRAAALLLFAGSLAALLAHGLTQPPVALAFGVLIAIGEAVRVGSPGGRAQAPLGAAIGLAYALLGPLRGLPTGHGVLQVVAVAGLGLATGALVRTLVLGCGRLRGTERSRVMASVPRPRSRTAGAPGPGRITVRGAVRGPGGDAGRATARETVCGAEHRSGHRRPGRRGFTRPPGPARRPLPLPWRTRRLDRSTARTPGRPVLPAVRRYRAHGWPYGPRVVARCDGAARRLLAVAFAATLFQPLYNSGALDRVPLAGPAYGVFLVLVAALAGLADAVLAACQHRCGGRFGAALEEELRTLPGIGSAIAATGMLISLAAGEVGLWALPVFCLPLLLAQASLRRAAAVRATYGQTIATLARATEVAGYTAPGHARRVADTACALGRELGLSTHDLALLEYAALMHDIGQLSLVEPVRGGATATLPEPEQQRIARLGSEVIRCTGVPGPVAEQVARLADPLLGPDGRTDRSLPLAARIIRVANAHEDLTGPAGGGEAALAVLRAGQGRLYDPVVVAALERVRAVGSGPCTVGRAESG
ncbi:HD-GYP domain-containing protein [Kitasatospora sp. NBC_01302]|uniref:HD-GYP domain-containing protein n=1 Tax=Kitasatospora sp. NBC_01302 TaxID=2903575 RepID=UPI003FA364F5